MRRDQDIKFSNRCSSFGKHATNPAKLGCGDFVERHSFNGGCERVDEPVEFP
jgi:hypothetical protein